MNNKGFILSYFFFASAVGVAVGVCFGFQILVVVAVICIYIYIPATDGCSFCFLPSSAMRMSVYVCECVGVCVLRKLLFLLWCDPVFTAALWWSPRCIHAGL
ncbi:hypothetical protein TRSC58_07653 [Trypanosoma rangeli SC58]|uniref:Uncharacterized protein n=1 Tax=Trypanosoma rangeli SC58 TaxID=429131 RepID=A0A061IRI7_TRYRA|nr:hypothetical protein TRSC58_07653 [Trypanosoma rangeli SC58]